MTSYNPRYNSNRNNLSSSGSEKSGFSVLGILASLVMSVVLMAAIGGVILFLYYSKDLPDYKQLENYRPPITSRVYSVNGEIVGEIAKEKRLLVPISEIPDLIKNAFIAAEDKTFYQHSGIDFLGIARAAFHNVFKSKDSSLSGASTITQQVVKNFLLTNERTISRKVKEAILAKRISKIYSKEKILELYLNQIYLGSGVYGVAAAALEYFGKSVSQINIEEAAILAALPKAPSILDPKKNPQGALERRNWVLMRMMEEGYITKQQCEDAKKKPVTLIRKKNENILSIPAYSFLDMVKKQLTELYSEKDVSENGMYIRTTINTHMQQAAARFLKLGLLDYDKRHGYAGPLKNISGEMKNWQGALSAVEDPKNIDNFKMAVVLDVGKDKATIGLKSGVIGYISLKKMLWARKRLEGQSVSQKPIKKISDVLAVGDVVLVEEDKQSSFSLEQIPKVNGAVVIMEPSNGRVLAMVGDYMEHAGNFNRAVQANRQPGSLIKPFVYAAAFDKGFTPADTVIETLIEIPHNGGKKIWKPKNATGDIASGVVTLRNALENSRNIATVKLAEAMGLEPVLDTIKKFGINQKPEHNLSIVLGSGETNLLAITNAYAIIANGGTRTSPVLIEKVQDRDGKVIFKGDLRKCDKCSQPINLENPEVPSLIDEREQVLDPRTAYQIISILEGVVTRGTARRALSVGKTLAGKTGTTNDSFDSWFVGFTPNVVIGVYVGFDQPQTLGKKEFGGTIALPIFVDIAKETLKDAPNTFFSVPNGIKMVKVDAATGVASSETSSYFGFNGKQDSGSAQAPKNMIYEVFKDTDKLPTGIPINKNDKIGTAESSDQNLSPAFLPPQEGAEEFQELIIQEERLDSIESNKLDSRLDRQSKKPSSYESNLPPAKENKVEIDGGLY